MKRLLILAALGGALLAACGGTETKTVTETVQSKAKTPAPERAAEESGGEAATTDEPTATTIPDGTWVKGEYTPGTYRAPGGAGCEWEQRQSLSQEAEGSGQWGIGESNILAEIDSPYFLTEGCGVWQKVG